MVKWTFSILFCVQLLVFFLFPSAILGASFTFNSSSISFTENITTRLAPGPYSAALLIQGDEGNSYNLTDDIVGFGRGTQIGGNFYQTSDTGQGTVLFWWTPEYSHDSINTNSQFLWYINANYYLSYDYQADQFRIAIGGQSYTVSSSLVAGSTYNLVTRWDTQNTISGSNYVCFSINDTHTCGITSQPSASAPSGTIYIGTNGSTQATSGIVEGLTFYRRVLYDGSNGINVGNGDEVNLIYNSGSGKDPTIVTGSWDMLLNVPTNSIVGTISTGAGQAWAHPVSTNLLTNGFLLNSTAWTGWSAIGSPTTGNLSSANQIYTGGYYFTSGGSNEGYYQDISVSGGDDFVARAVVNSDGTCAPRLELYDQSLGSSINFINGNTTATRTAPDELILTGEISGSGSKTLRVRLLNTAASGTCSWHSLEVYANLWNDPSIETGTALTNVGSPTSSQQSTTQAHTGTNSWQIISNAADQGARQSISTVNTGFYATGGYVYADTAGTVDLSAPWQDGSTSVLTTSGNNTWKRITGVFRASGGSTNVDWVSNGAQTFYVDDVYALTATSVSLSITPATKANSTQNTGIRIDGRDSATQSISELGVSSGNIKFRYIPRHSSAKVANFLESPSSNAYIGEWYRSANDTIQLYWSSANNLTMRTVRNGVASSSSWDATGSISQGTAYYIEIEYKSVGTQNLKVDGQTKISLTSLSDFSSAPNTSYWGTSSSNNQQGDAIFDSWEDPAMTFTINAVNANTVTNGVTTTTASQADALPFGHISSNSLRLMAHRLYASTNAASGYTVTMNILATSIIQGLDPANVIDPFSATGASWSTPIPWTSPTGSVSNVNSGWIGANTSDTRVSGWSSASTKFGPVSTSARQVMVASGPDAGTSAYVTYALEVNVYQPQDTYSGTIIYTVVPTY